MPGRTIEYARLPTERPNPRSQALDCLSILQILRLMNREDAHVPRAIGRVLPQIAAAVNLIASSLRSGHRLFFLGAGTSGRLGVIEAAECPPTFNTRPDQLQAIIAGGPRAVFRSQEGAEDQRHAARAAIRRRVQAGDAVVGIAASGVTPFVAAGLRTAAQRGASTMLITCHPETALRSTVDVLIAPSVGPEVITGSTRLKSGTATKLILNMLTVASMVQLGKVYGHTMVDVKPASRKLRARALRIVQITAGVSEPRAAVALRHAQGHVKQAIVMAALRIPAAQARRLLQASHGKLAPLLHADIPTRSPG